MISNLTAPGGLFRLCSIGVALMLAWVPAWAVLGGRVDTIQADQETMKGTRRVTNTAAYSIHEIQAATGTKVREFVSPTGTVFAVAWNGPVTPDLRQLLGQYFDQAAQGQTQTGETKRVARGRVTVQQQDLVVEAGGHMRSFFGRAYLPQMMPQGVASAEIK